MPASPNDNLANDENNQNGGNTQQNGNANSPVTKDNDNESSSSSSSNPLHVVNPSGKINKAAMRRKKNKYHSKHK